jgi:hypothetical protein
MVESIREAVRLSGWKYSYRLTERCTGLFIGLLQKNCLRCRNTHWRHTAERCSKWNERKRRMSFLSMMIIEFLVQDERVPCQWLSMTSVSMMMNEFLVNDYRRFLCRWWWTSSLSMIINDFRVDDDERVPCQWLHWSTKFNFLCPRNFNKLT